MHMKKQSRPHRKMSGNRQTGRGLRFAIPSTFPAYTPSVATEDYRNFRPGLFLSMRKPRLSTGILLFL